MDLTLRCQCGQAIQMNNIVWMDYYPRTLSPNRIHIKYVCPECGHVQEKMLRQYEWDQIVLYGTPYEETSLDEKARFDCLGPITHEERRQVHDTLAHSNPLEQLREWADRSQDS